MEEYKNVIWYYQLSWQRKFGHREEFQRWRFELKPFVRADELEQEYQIILVGKQAEQRVAGG